MVNDSMDASFDEKTALRDALARERTALANERTLLAYVRTSLTLLVVAVSLLAFTEHQGFHAAGLAFAVLSIVIVVVGAIRFFQVRALTRSRASSSR
jgi:putative membrane protein